MEKKSVKKKIILVVEDEQSLLNVVNSRLGRKGFKVLTARSVDQVFNAGLVESDVGIVASNSIMNALDYLDDLQNVDAIWLDHNLIGKENGIDFIKKLKANGGHWKKIPIFVVSNSEGSATIKSYFNLGVSKYYIKSNHKLDEIIMDINLFLSSPK